MKNGKIIKIKVRATQEFFDLPIGVLDLSTRAHNGLKRGRINTLEDLTDRWSILDNIKGLGAESIRNIRNKFIEYYISDYLGDKPSRTEEFLEELAAV
jgi:DNA-directed RNA polymerase alpha subunit